VVGAAARKTRLWVPLALTAVRVARAQVGVHLTLPAAGVALVARAVLDPALARVLGREPSAATLLGAPHLCSSFSAAGSLTERAAACFAIWAAAAAPLLRQPMRHQRAVQALVVGGAVVAAALGLLQPPLGAHELQHMGAGHLSVAGWADARCVVHVHAFTPVVLGS
jgi:hypothetical protein